MIKKKNSLCKCESISAFSLGSPDHLNICKIKKLGIGPGNEAKDKYLPYSAIQRVSSIAGNFGDLANWVKIAKHSDCQIGLILKFCKVSG